MSSMSIQELSILLIEPSTTQLKIVLNMLKQAGVEKIDGVASGEEALTLINQYPPDLIISAMYLPDMTATELLSTLRHDEAHKAINFMLVSSETSFTALDPIRQAGVVAILPKPFSNDDLQRALRTSLEYIDPEEIDLEHYDVRDLKVLVVDDSMTARNHVSRVLSNLGITNIDTANNGVEAVHALADKEYDLVVTDFNMPEMDGQQLVEYIRSEMGNSYVPILMVTSEEDESRLGNVQQAGVSAICDKPFEPQSVREVLYRVLND